MFKKIFGEGPSENEGPPELTETQRHYREVIRKAKLKERKKQVEEEMEEETQQTFQRYKDRARKMAEDNEDITYTEGLINGAEIIYNTKRFEIDPEHEYVYGERDEQVCELLELEALSQGKTEEEKMQIAQLIEKMHERAKPDETQVEEQ